MELPFLCYFDKTFSENRDFTPDFFRFAGQSTGNSAESRNFEFQRLVLPAVVADKTAFYRIFAYDPQRKPTLCYE